MYVNAKGGQTVFNVHYCQEEIIIEGGLMYNVHTCMYCICTHICTSKKNLNLDVRMEKEQKQELGWRIFVLPIPAFHRVTYMYISGMQEWVIQIPSIPNLVSVLFPSLHLNKIFVTSLYCFMGMCNR